MIVTGLTSNLQCGTQLLEWDASSLVIPQQAAKVFNRKALFALDLEFVEKDSFNKEMIPKVESHFVC